LLLSAKQSEAFIRSFAKEKPIYIITKPHSNIKDASLQASVCKILGGDGGELNSPSKRSYPEYATSLVSSFILPG